MDPGFSPLDLLVHLDRHLLVVARDYGNWIYALLFLIVFCETGLVVTPFLPGDSLLFAAGAVAGAGAVNVHLLAVLLFAAAVLGDGVNYSLGRYLGPRVFRSADSWFFRKEYLDRAQAFFSRHGGKSIVIARFVPLVRTYVPFVAGIGRMTPLYFVTYNVLGALLWVGLVLYAGYFFGGMTLVKNNLTAVILAIIALSISPGIIAVVRAKLGRT